MFACRPVILLHWFGQEGIILRTSLRLICHRDPPDHDGQITTGCEAFQGKRSTLSNL